MSTLAFARRRICATFMAISLPTASDRDLAKLGRHAAEWSKASLTLPASASSNTFGAGFPPSADGGAEGIDQGALLRGLGDGLKTGDRVQRGGGRLAVSSIWPCAALSSSQRITFFSLMAALLKALSA